jgi:hypothetical protein
MHKRPVPIVAALLALAPIWGTPLSAAAPPAGGTISIEPKTADGDYDRSMPAFVSAAADALAAKGFTILEDAGHSAYVVELILSRVAVGTASAKTPAGKPSVGGGGPGPSVGVGGPCRLGLVWPRSPCCGRGWNCASGSAALTMWCGTAPR